MTRRTEARETRSRPSPRSVATVVLTLLSSLPCLTIAAQRPYDVLIRGGTVVDGSGAARFRADVGLRGDRIVRVDRSGIDTAAATLVIDATGLIVAPGFIDSHAHVGLAIKDHPLAESLLRQGITTVMASLHSQDEPWPLDAYMATLRMAPNVGFFAGHSWIRKRVIGMSNRPPTEVELAHMVALVDSSMRQGALGLATGLEYVPANFSTTLEVIAMAAAAASRGGVYMTHLRDEGLGLLTSIRETIRIGQEAHIPVQINHLKASGAAQWGWSVRSLSLIDSARAAGLDVTHDVYPYAAFSTISDVLFPQWALADGRAAFKARVSDPATRARISREMQDIFPQQAGPELSSIQFRTLASDPRYSGRTLADYVTGMRRPTTIDEGIRATIDLQSAGGFEGIFHAMDEQDVQRFMRHPAAMIESDGDLVEIGIGFPHPRSYGAFPRVLGRYVRDLKVLTLEQAIQKMTMLPANQLGQLERGRIREASIADIVVFDAEKIQDLATYIDPHRYPVGVVHLLVNGIPVIRAGALTGATPGQAIRGPARALLRR